MIWIVLGPYGYCCSSARIGLAWARNNVSFENVNDSVMMLFLQCYATSPTPCYSTINIHVRLVDVVIHGYSK